MTSSGPGDVRTMWKSPDLTDGLGVGDHAAFAVS